MVFKNVDFQLGVMLPDEDSATKRSSAVHCHDKFGSFIKLPRTHCWQELANCKCFPPHTKQSTLERLLLPLDKTEFPLQFTRERCFSCHRPRAFWSSCTIQIENYYLSVRTQLQTDTTEVLTDLVETCTCRNQTKFCWWECYQKWGKIFCRHLSAR